MFVTTIEPQRAKFSKRGFGSFFINLKTIIMNEQFLRKKRGQCTLLIYQLVKLVDEGKSIQIEEAFEMIKSQGLKDWLKNNYNSDWIWDDEKINQSITDDIIGLYETCGTDKHPGKNNGFLLLISFLAEILIN